MKIKLLIATDDADYAEHSSGCISEHHSDVIDVSVCRTREHLQRLLIAQRFDAALLEASMAKSVDLSAINLPLLLWSEEECASAGSFELKKINKYQRISSIVAELLELCAKTLPEGCDPEQYCQGRKS